MQPYWHPNALVEPGARLGARTRVWAFAHVLPGAVVGDDCNLCDHTFVEGKVTLGDRVTVKCGVFLWDGVTVEDDVFIGPGAVFTNDLRPRSRHYPAEYGRTLLRQGCSVGAGAILLPGITVGRWAMIGAGSVVTRNVPDFALVRGNPARFVGWVCQCGCRLQAGAAAGRWLCACGSRYLESGDAALQPCSGHD